jgi:phospho-N-acetylmuramoyl-pentapeptide-transferase
MGFDIVTVVAAFVASAALYPMLIAGLRRLRVRQVIQAELLAEHHRKAGTPTGGGVLFLALGIADGLVSLGTHRGSMPAVAALLLFGGLGLLDDLRKLRVGSIGIPTHIKFVLQILLSVPVAWLAYRQQMWIPAQWGWIYWPLAMAAIVGSANAVNLTDGLDGLAAGLAAIALTACVLMVPGSVPGERAVALTLVGGLLAFLVFNRHPARAFMGDMGSLALGAALAAMALQQGWVLLLLVLGLVFVLETLSVMVQVGFFKLTGGRRIFKMTPIHLTFQLQGWSENRIALTFWGAGMAAALISGWIAHFTS